MRPKIKLEFQGESLKDSCTIRKVMMYGAETWAVKTAKEKKLDVADMTMLRWMSGVTKYN